MLADAQKPVGQAVGPPGWAWGMTLPLWHHLCHVNCSTFSCPCQLALLSRRDSKETQKGGKQEVTQ